MRVLSFVVRIARCSVPSSSSSLRSIPILGCTSSPLVTHPPKKLANTNAIITTTTTTLHASFSSFSSSSFSSSTPRRWSLSLFFRANLQQQQQHHHPRHGAHPTIPMLRRRSFLTTTTTMLSKQKSPQKNSKQKQHEQQQQQQQQIKLQRQREIVDRIRSAMLHLISASSNAPPASKAAENTTNDVAASITTTTTTGKDLVEQIISIAQQQSNNNNNNSSSNSALSKDARDDCILAFDVAIRTLVSSNKIDLARSLFEELLAMRTMGTDSNIITPPTDYDQGGPDPILTLFHTLIAQLCLGGHWSEVRPMLLDQQLARSIGEVTKSADPITMTNNNSNNKNNNHHNDYHYENDRVWSEIYRIYLDTLCKTNEFQRALKLFYQIANEVNNNNNNSSSSSSNRNSKSQASPSNSISTNPIIVNVNEYYVPPRLGGGNTALCNVIIKGMIHNGRIDDAVKLLGVMHATAESAESDREKDDPLYSIRPDVGSYNAFISEYIARAKRATQLLHRLASGSYVPPQQMMAINKMMIIDNTRGSRIQWNRGGSSSSRNNPKMNAKVMLKMYRKESLKRAREYLEKMQQEHGGGGGGVKPDLTTYGAFISYYCKEGTASSMQEAMQWVSRMQQDKIEVELGDGKTKKVSRLVPDTSIFNMLIEGFGRSRQLDSALQCYEELARQKHCRPNAITLNVLIDTCSFNNRLDLALQFFQDAYNRQLQLQQQQQQQEPIQLQQKQQQQPSKRRHQQKQQKQKQKQQHDTDEDDDEEFIVELDINHYTSIIEACGRHRDDKTARKIFGLLLEQMHKQLVATTTSSSSAAAFANTMHTTATAKHHHHHHHGVLLLYPTAKLFRTLIYNVYIANQKQHAARKLVMELIKNTKNGNINNNNNSNNNKQKKQRQQQQQQQQHDADTNIPSFRLVEPALSEFVKFLAHPKARRDLGIADETYLQFLYSQYGPDAKMPSVAEAAAAAEEEEAEEAGVEIL